MSRVRTGWRLAKESWALLRADRSLAAFPALSTVFVAIALALTLTPGLVASEALDRDWLVLPFMLVGGYAAIFFVVYFNVALAAAARLSMDGRDTKPADGLAVSRKRRGLIAKWALLQFSLGVLTRFAQRLTGDSAGGVLLSIVFGLTGVVWSVASFFAVPLLALEGLGPGATLKRSASLVRKRWGEGLVGYTAINTAVFLVAVLPLLALFNLALGAIEIDATVGAVLGVLAILALIATCVTSSALSVIFRVGLYRYATAGQVTGGFAQQDMVAAFRPAERRLR
jgi:hypothetical protein